MAWAIRFLEDVAPADLAFEARGESLEEVFRAATQALLESMADPATVPGEWERTIERSNADHLVKAVSMSGLAEEARLAYKKGVGIASNREYKGIATSSPFEVR